ncbi:MAG: M24 family metallopeptidase [Coriobacteriales bacterium]|nr:M24 family metallopeptidase [Coriobacteriales bacterium]
MKHTIELRKVPTPKRDHATPIALTDATLEERKAKVLARMAAAGLDKLVVYCDVEHAWNFAYLVGYYTRFEEGLMVLDAAGDMRLVLGNENLNKAGKARFTAEGILASKLSLPNQPQKDDRPMAEYLTEAGIACGQKVGLAGWKLFTGKADQGLALFDAPAFVVDALRELVGKSGSLVNATALFVGEDGARETNNANEIAHYEFGAALAGDCMLDTMDAVVEGATELELGDKLVRYGQHTTVTTIAATGERFLKANMFPAGGVVKAGNPISLTVGYQGGSSSRSSYAVHDAGELPVSARDWMDEMAKPYFDAYVTWLEAIRIGMVGGELFDIIEDVLPRAEYGWSLCPGHLIAEEEWLCSPVYEGSAERLKSGMMFQIDIIPGKPGMNGCCAESTVVLADAQLKADLAEQYPLLWSRMQERIAYVRDVLGVELSNDVLPMCSSVAYLRPYLLNHDEAFVVAK